MPRIFDRSLSYIGIDKLPDDIRRLYSIKNIGPNQLFVETKTKRIIRSLSFAESKCGHHSAYEYVLVFADLITKESFVFYTPSAKDLSFLDEVEDKFDTDDRSQGKRGMNEMCCRNPVDLIELIIDETLILDDSLCSFIQSKDEMIRLMTKSSTSTASVLFKLECGYSINISSDILKISSKMYSDQIEDTIVTMQSTTNTIIEIPRNICNNPKIIGVYVEWLLSLGIVFDDNNIYDIYRLADYMQSLSLIELCVKLIPHHITTNNIINILLFSVNKDLTVYNSCLSWFVYNKEYITEYKEYLDKNVLIDIIELLL